MPKPGVTAQVPLTRLLIVSNPRTLADPTRPASMNTAPTKCRRFGPSGRGIRYSTLPSTSDVPPSGWLKKSELLSFGEFGSQKRSDPSVGAHLPPLIPPVV